MCLIKKCDICEHRDFIWNLRAVETGALKQPLRQSTMWQNSYMRNVLSFLENRRAMREPEYMYVHRGDCYDNALIEQSRYQQFPSTLQYGSYQY